MACSAMDASQDLEHEPPVREFCQEARDAEKRFSGITYRSFRNLRQLLCASFGFEFSKY